MEKTTTMVKKSLSYSVRVVLALGVVLTLLGAPPNRPPSAAPGTLFVTFTQIADSSTAIPGSIDLLPLTENGGQS